jgi:hypothetical protein
MSTQAKPPMRGEMTFTEIAGRLGCSPSAASSAFYHAVEKLRKQTPNSLLLLLVYAKELERVREKRKVA